MRSRIPWWISCVAVLAIVAVGIAQDDAGAAAADAVGDAAAAVAEGAEEAAGAATTAVEEAAEEVEEAAPPVSEEMFTVNNVWMMVCTFLVFIMHLGFASVESGLTRAKNTVNILFKNTAIIAIGLLTYTVIGFNLMYPGTNEGGFFGFAGFWIDAGTEGETIAYADGAYTYWTDFLFQGMFAATAAPPSCRTPRRVSRS